MGLHLGVGSACEPPPPNVVRLNPFFVQGAKTLAEKDRPLLPRNVDFSLAVLYADRVEPGSFRLLRDAAGGREPELTLTAEDRRSEVVVRVHPAMALVAGAGYSVYGVLAGQRQRIFQFQTSGSEDRVAPAAPQIVRSVQLGRFKAGGGLCDDGHARWIATVSARDDQTPEDQLRYLVEGAGEPQLVSAWCRLIDVRLPDGPSGPLRLTAIDLAGNRSPTVSLNLPPAQSGSWEAVRAQRECSPGR